MSRPLLLGLVLLAAGPAGAEGIRCGSRLVSEGDPAARLEDACGPPDHLERQVRSTRVAAFPLERAVDEIIERWIYAGEDGRLMRLVEVRRGRVASIRTLGVRGRGEDGCPLQIFARPTTTGQVELACGAPDDRSAWTELRTIVSKGAAISRTIQHESWVYLLGGGRLLRVLEFEDGKLVGGP
ncbi:MAG: DUF2845 domain-containing protein [Myxococcota bacterium]